MHTHFWIVDYLKRWQWLFRFTAGGYKKFYLYRVTKSGLRRAGYWWIDTALLLGDVACVPELFLAVEWLFLPVRSLESAGYNFYEIPYSKGINPKWVRIHKNPKIRPNARTHAYVSFRTINYWHHLTNETFLHELMHIWQFYRVGSIYIHHALRAQRMQPSYDYGSLQYNLEHHEAVNIWRDFNFEQMASLGADLQLFVKAFPEDSRAIKLLDQFL